MSDSSSDSTEESKSSSSSPQSLCDRSKRASGHNRDKPYTTRSKPQKFKNIRAKATAAYWHALDNPYPVDDFPDLLVRRPRTRCQPPEFILGWVINTDDFIEKAKEYDALRVDPKYLSGIYVEEPNIAASIDALGWAIQKKLDIKLPVDFFFILGQRRSGEWVYMVHVCTNYNLSKKPSDEEIEKIQGVLGIKEPPQWYPHRWGRNWGF